MSTVTVTVGPTIALQEIETELLFAFSSVEPFGLTTVTTMVFAPFISVIAGRFTLADPYCAMDPVQLIV